MLKTLTTILQKEYFIEGEITPDKRLKEDLNIDSLTAADLIMNLEERFGAKVNDDELKNIQTVGDILKIIESKTKKK